MKKTYIELLLITTIFIGCTPNSAPNTDASINESNTIQQDTNQHNIDKNNINEYDKFNNLLENQEYTTKTTCGYKYLTIIIYNPDDLSILSNKDYYIKNNASLDVSIENGYSFLTSLSINPTVAYSWNIVNNPNYSCFKLNNTSSVNLPSKDNNTGAERVEGVGLGRQNFYFSTDNIGYNSIDFELSSYAYKSTDNFKIKLNLNII